MAERPKTPVVEEVGPYRPGIVVTSDKFVAKSGISTFDNVTGKTKKEGDNNGKK
jgi:hypothetical protein